MSHKFLVDNFEWEENTSNVDEKFIKNCHENSNERYIVVDVKYPIQLPQNDISLLPERMRVEKCNNLVCN